MEMCERTFCVVGGSEAGRVWWGDWWHKINGDAVSGKVRGCTLTQEPSATFLQPAAAFLQPPVASCNLLARDLHATTQGNGLATLAGDSVI